MRRKVSVSLESRREAVKARSGECGLKGRPVHAGHPRALRLLILKNLKSLPRVMFASYGLRGLQGSPGRGTASLQMHMLPHAPDNPPPQGWAASRPQGALPSMRLAWPGRGSFVRLLPPIQEFFLKCIPASGVASLQSSLVQWFENSPLEIWNRFEGS